MSHELITTMIKYLSNYWKRDICSICERNIFYKNESDIVCPKCKGCVQNKYYKRRLMEEEHICKFVADQIVDYLTENEGILQTHAKPIWKTFGEQVFVGSGLEYIYDYKYKDLDLPELPVVIFQPCIRWNRGIKDSDHARIMLEHLYSLAFTNVSIMRIMGGTCDFVKSFEASIDLLSFLGIHANRLCICIDPSPHFFSDLSFSVVVRIFVDGLEVGDHVALFTDNKKTIIETGFGLERLATRLTNKPYTTLLTSVNSVKMIVLAVHALTLITMSDVPFKRRNIWYRANQLMIKIKEHRYQFDSYMLFSDFYDRWQGFVHRPMDKLNSYFLFLRLLEDE